MRHTLILTVLFLTMALPLPKALSQLVTLPNDFTGPFVLSDIANMVDPDTSTTLAFDLRNHFQVANVLGQVVQFDSNLGKIDLELFDANTPYNRPITVANFLNLVNGGNYDNSIIHRSALSFVIQGGGFINNQGVGDFALNPVTDVDPVLNEPGISNTLGTISMAKLGGDPNSATNQWFFNLVNNTADGVNNLDDQNGGFTVFGRVIGSSISTVNAIANLTRWNLDGGVFNNVPLTGFNGEGTILPEHWITFSTVSTIALYPTQENPDAVLSFQFTNSNQNLLTVTIVGSELRLDFNPGQTGDAEITVATFDTHGLTAEISFLVTVTNSNQGDVFGGTDIPNFPGWKSSPWYANYNTSQWPWIFHDEHGWQFVFEGSTAEVIFLFDLGLQEWIFLNENTYRWQFLFSDTPGWIWTFGDNTPDRRFFQRLDDGSLFSVPPGLPVN